MAFAIKNVRNFVADTHAGGMLAKRVWTRSAQQPLDVDIYTFEPGGAQDTHYHPDSAELAICWSGRGRATIVLPQGTVDAAWKANPAWQPLCLEIELAPGDTLVVPQGALHRLEATLFSDADKPKLPADKRAIDRALNGDGSGLNDYAQWTHAQFDGYLQSRAKYYRAEQRWPDAPFWRRRHFAS